MIIGTAGHIDHGKSALVQALTGQAMDRLAEERRRGITIDLNFAPLNLGDGRIAGVVDVPGHEDLVRTMVAGAAGVDVVLLVIAADEGIMPQTREHLAVVEQLGIPHGIPVVTKRDLVDAEWLALVSSEVGEWLEHSSVKFSPPLAVSATRGEGLDGVSAELRRLADQLPPRAADDFFRLPVDRVFSLAGIGTVVTGTAWSGRIRVGDEVRLLPTDLVGRVRSIEIHGRQVEVSEPGARTALGLSGIEREAVRRGAVATWAADRWSVTTAFDAELRLLPSAPRPLVHRARVRVHHGAAVVMARVHLRAAIEPGGVGVARLSLEEPAVARGGDRLVLRSYSPVATIGGGRVLDPAPPGRAGSWPVEATANDVPARLSALVARRASGVLIEEFPVLLGESPAGIRSRLEALPELRTVAGRVVPGSAIATLREAAVARVAALHRQCPAERGLSIETLRAGLGAVPEVVEAALTELVASGRLELTDGVARVPGFTSRVAGGSDAVERLVALIAEAGLSPPNVAELGAATGRRDVADALRIAARDGRVVPVERDRYYGAPALERFRLALSEIGAGGPITPAQLRDRLGISRKFLIPLLEWADRSGLTVRTGEERRLK